MRLILASRRKFLLTMIISLMMLAICMELFPCAGKVLSYPLYRKLTKTSFTNECKSYGTLDKGSFIIYYEDGYSECAGSAAESVEECLQVLKEDFGYTLPDKMNVIIYPEYEKMARMMSLGTGSPALGAYYCGNIGIFKPDSGRDTGLIKDNLLIHEITHYVLDYMSGGNIPPWFTEGAALYEEYTAYGIEWAKDSNYSNYYKVKELEGNFYGLDEIKAYKESFLIVKYIGDNFGYDGINRIVKELRTGKSMEQALYNVCCMDEEEILARSLKY